MLGEANSEGAWTKLATELLPEDEPMIKGVDFPTVAMSEARWVENELRLNLHPQNAAVKGQETSFRIVGLDHPARWTVSGQATSQVDELSLMVRTQVFEHSLVIRRSE